MSLQRQIFIWAVVLCVFVYILYALSGVLLPFVAGMTIGYLLDPLANRLERWGLSRLGATALILGLFVILLLVLLVLFVPILAHQFTAFLLNLPVIAARLQALVVEEIVKLADRYGGETLKAFGLTAGLTQAEVQSSVNSFVGQWSNYLVAFLNQLWSGSRALFGVFSLLIVTPVVAFYILLDWKRMVAAIDGWIPLPHRESVRSIARDIDAALAGFVRGQSLVSLVLGLWYSIGLTLVGLNFGFLIGISGGVLSFVPYIGSLIVLLLATAVAVVQGWPDWTLIAETLAVVVAGQFLEGKRALAEPRRRLDRPAPRLADVRPRRLFDHLRLHRAPGRGPAVGGSRRAVPLRLAQISVELALYGRSEDRPHRRPHVTQLPLGLALPPRYGSSDFLASPSNAAALAAIARWPHWPDPVLIVVGPAGSGKTHLSHLWAGRAGARRLDGADLANLLPEVAAGHAVIDGADDLALPEAQFFHLLNLIRERRSSLLITARKPPDRWSLATP